MGLFGGKKIIVSSTLYNMAGDEANRPDFLKGTLFASILEGSDSISDSLQTAYSNGPGMTQRLFFNYAKRNNLAGLPTTIIGGQVSVDSATVGGEITIPPTPVGLQLSVQNAYVNYGDYEPWVRRYVAINYPARMTEAWIADYEPSTDTFSVQFPNGDFYSWSNATESPVYDPAKRYITATYFTYLDDNTQPLVEQSNGPVTSQVNLTGYTQQSSTGTSTPVTLQRVRTTIWTFSNGDPPVTVEDAVDADVADTLNTSVDVWDRTDFVAYNDYETEGLYKKYTYTGTDSVVGGYSNVVVTQTDLGGGVIRTETSTTTGEQVSVSWNEKYDTQVIYEGTVIGGEQIFLYEEDTGNATLDALFVDKDATNYQEFFPFLPLRLNNKALDEEPYLSNGLYEETKKAYRRATDLKSIDKVLTAIADNESIGDIDYAYMAYGCALNVKENACRKYIYEFFANLIPVQSSTANTIADFQAAIAAYNAQVAALIAWENSSPPGTWTARIGRPDEPYLEMPPISSIIIRADSVLMPSYDFRIEWVHIGEETINGTYTYTDVTPSRPANQGEVMIQNGTHITWNERSGLAGITGVETIGRQLDCMELYYQITPTQYKKLTVYGATHKNYVYGGKFVENGSADAIDDTDISGFLVPLHYPTFKNLTIIDYTQMATADTHIVFNSYEIVKQKWYESALFQIIIVIIVIILAVIFFPSAFAAGGGLLGSNAAIGAALGLSGTAALVAGVLANYLAALIVSEILKFVGTALLGEKWGAIFAAVVGFVIGNMGNLDSLFSVEGVFGLLGALANGYAGYVQGDINEMREEIDEFRETYEERMKYIDNLLADLFGNDLNFNPLFLTDSIYGNDSRKSSTGYIPETADEFIRRTTMTGSQIVELSQGMVYDFTDMMTTLPRN